MAHVDQAPVNDPQQHVEKGAMDNKKEKEMKESEKEKDTVAEGSGAGAKPDDDVMYIQDVGFNVHISVPGLEQFTIQVSSMELVQEIHQLLMDREDTCHRTCFSLQLDGAVLDNFAELKNVEGLQEGSVLKLVEEPYTMRESRIHLRHVRDLLKSVDNVDAYCGSDCSSLSFLNMICQGDMTECGGAGANGSSSGSKKRNGKSAAAADNSSSSGIDCTPPAHVLPQNTERPLLPLHPNQKDNSQKLPCLKVLTMSGWNPPPGQRKLHGDLMYIHAVTLEDKRYHVTSSTKGFYVNRSTEELFDPRPAPVNYLSHSLIDLLSQLSPGFKKNFGQLQKRRIQRHPFERVATPYQIYTWMSPSIEHTIDAIRAEDAFSSKLGYEEHIPGQTRDWNEELQTTRELPRKSLPERLLRERAIFKVHSDFVSAATRGATAVIDGNVMAINPGEEPKMQMFIWNNIFFSLGFDVRDHYKDLGGDHAAFVAPQNDLQGVKVYNAVDLEGLYTLGTVVIDYRGFRVTAQSIIPGILEREQEQSVVYGSIDFGKTVISHPKYIDLLQKAGSQLKILPHIVLNEKKEEVMLCSSVECKGIIGNDNRHYILDLLRTFPPDVNFLSLPSSQLTLSKEAQALGFPVAHKHKLACLRQELIDAFVESRYMMFIKYAAVQLQQLGLKKQMDSKKQEQPAIEDEKEKEKDKEESNKTADAAADADDSNKSKLEEDEAKKIVESITDSITSGDKRDIEESTKDIVKKAAQAVGSLKETEFDIRFNPDIFSPGVVHASSEEENLKKQRTLAKDAADFLITVQIPAFIRDCLDHTSAPMDGQTLSDNLHNRGINIRYIGTLASMLKNVPQLSYIHSLVVSEIVCRSAKHVFVAFLQGLDVACVSAAVGHFLNCFFQPATREAGQPQDQLLVGGGRNASGNGGGKSKRNGRKKNHSSGGHASHSAAPSGPKPLTNDSIDSLEWTTLTAKSLWKVINQETKYYYNFDLNMDDIEEICKLYSLQKVSLLRSLCQKTGLQLQLREYFDGSHKNSNSGAYFHEEDVLNIFPRVKHINPRATDAYNFYTTGQNKIQQGFLKDGYELISEALNLLNNVYGAMHPEIAQCLRMLARLNYIMGDHAEAMAYQQKAVLMSERVNGIDHPYTITEYVHLALYCFANSQVSAALKLLYRARYLCLLIASEDHPEVALIDSNIGLILHAVSEYDLSLKFLEKSLELNKRFHGAQSLKVAVNFHLVARTQSCMGDFRSALLNEKETYTIYKSQLGPDHEKTKESNDCLVHLTNQAVVLQKKMNDIYCGKTRHSLPPIQIQPPSMGSVLDMLNMINGILFVQISQQDIESLRQDFEKKAAAKAEASGDSATPAAITKA